MWRGWKRGKRGERGSREDHIRTLVPGLSIEVRRIVTRFEIPEIEAVE